MIFKIKNLLVKFDILANYNATMMRKIDSIFLGMIIITYEDSWCGLMVHFFEFGISMNKTKTSKDSQVMDLGLYSCECFKRSETIRICLGRDYVNNVVCDID